MSDTYPKNPRAGMNGLLCPDTLRAAMRGSRDAKAEPRDGMKDLFSSAPAVEPPVQISLPAAPALPSESGASEEFSRWDRCLELLVNDFISRRHELLRLNKARKNQIEEFLCTHSGHTTTLDEAVQGRMGGPEQEALQLFAHQACVFHLLQIVLLKRWIDRGHLAPDTLKLPTQEHSSRYDGPPRLVLPQAKPFQLVQPLEGNLGTPAPSSRARKPLGRERQLPCAPFANARQPQPSGSAGL